MKLDLKQLGVSGRGTLITDGGDPLGFKSDYFPLDKSASSGEIEIRGRGGFVLHFD